MPHSSSQSELAVLRRMQRLDSDSACCFGGAELNVGQGRPSLAAAAKLFELVFLVAVCKARPANGEKVCVSNGTETRRNKDAAVVESFKRIYHVAEL